MQFDIRSFLESGRKPFEAHFEADFSKADFGGYSVNTPAVCDFTATLTEDGAELLLCVRAHIDACLLYTSILVYLAAQGVKSYPHGV